MMNLKNTLCRTCLVVVRQPKAFNIFNTEDLAKKVKFCSRQPVEADDEYPNQLCEKCHAKIIIFYEFQQMCCKSLKTFLELLNDEQITKKSNIETHNDEQDKELRSYNLQIFNEVCGNKKMCTPVISKLENQKPDTTTVINPTIIRNVPEAVDDNIALKDTTKSDLKEYLQFEKKYESCEEYKKNVTNQTCFKQEQKIHFSVEDLQMFNLNSEHDNKTRNQTEKLNLADDPICGPTQKLSTSERQDHHCNRCGLRFKSFFKLQIHIRQHNGLPPYLCSFKGCECSFDRWHSYKKHQKTHNDKEQKFKCDLDDCERVYKNISNLNIHKRKFHNFGQKLKTHMCEICGKVFKSSAVLNEHHFTHIDKTLLPYACEEEYCTKRFSNKEKLKIHKLRHAGIKNFVCPHCGMRKTTRNELTIHINYHTLERTWPCRYCPKVCNSAGNLKVHVKNMHERAKDFACRFCERTFAKADTKKYHEMTHTGEKPNECKECGRRFVQPAALRTHRKIHLRQKIKLTDNVEIEAATAIEKRCDVSDMDEANLLTESIVADILNETIES